MVVNRTSLENFCYEKGKKLVNSIFKMVLSTFISTLLSWIDNSRTSWHLLAEVSRFYFFFIFITGQTQYDYVSNVTVWYTCSSICLYDLKGIKWIQNWFALFKTLNLYIIQT